MTGPLFGGPDDEHLSPETREVMGAEREVREDWLHHVPFFTYDSLVPIFAEALFLARQPRLPRPRNLLIMGPTNCGKSSLLKRIASELQAGGEHALDHPNPVMQYICTSGIRRDDFIDSFIRGSGIGVDLRRSLRAGDIARFAPVMLIRGPRVAIVDELQNVLSRVGNRRPVVDGVTTLRDFSTQFQLPIIAAGTDKALYAIRSDAQLENRFSVMPVTPLRAGAPFVRMLMAFERWLPLARPSHLRNKEFADYLYEVSGGWIGELKDALHRGVRYAIAQDEACLSVELMQAAGCLSFRARRARNV